MTFGTERVAKRTARNITRVQPARRDKRDHYAWAAGIETNRRQAANLKAMAAEAEAAGMSSQAADYMASAAIHAEKANELERLIREQRV